jgi:hypothetical protein
MRHRKKSLKDRPCTPEMPHSDHPLLLTARGVLSQICQRVYMIDCFLRSYRQAHGNGEALFQQAEDATGDLIQINDLIARIVKAHLGLETLQTRDIRNAKRLGIEMLQR